MGVKLALYSKLLDDRVSAWALSLLPPLLHKAHHAVHRPIHGEGHAAAAVLFF